MKSFETSYLYIVIANGVTTQLCGKSLDWHTITGIQLNASVGIPTELCCNTISYNYAQITCFTAFYHQDPYSFFKLIIFNILVCLVFFVMAYSYMATRHA